MGRIQKHQTHPPGRRRRREPDTLSKKVHKEEKREQALLLSAWLTRERRTLIGAEQLEIGGEGRKSDSLMSSVKRKNVSSQSRGQVEEKPACLAHARDNRASIQGDGRRRGIPAGPTNLPGSEKGIEHTVGKDEMRGISPQIWEAISVQEKFVGR